MKRIVALVLVVSGCSPTGIAPDDLSQPDGRARPLPRPGAGGSAPPPGATTAEAFDTTTPGERAVAVAAPEPAGEAKLGRTVAALGSPAKPGFWLETPLVDRVRPGRVVARANGKSVQVELRPTGGEAGSGSRISLPALRLLGVGLTGLHEVDVFAK